MIKKMFVIYFLIFMLFFIVAQEEVISIENSTITINGILRVGQIKNIPKVYQKLINANINDDAQVELTDEIEIYDQVLLVNIGSTNKLINIPVIINNNSVTIEILPSESVQLLKISDSDFVIIGDMPLSVLWPVGISYIQYFDPNSSLPTSSPTDLGLPGVWLEGPIIQHTFIQEYNFRIYIRTE